MIKLWGHPRAPNVRKVIWMMREVGVAFELLPTGGSHGGQNTAEYLARNPNGRIPTIEDGGFVLWESHTILRYLARKANCDALYPSDAQSAAITDQWLDWHGQHMGPAVRTLVLMTVRAEAPSDPVDLSVAQAEAEGLFAIMESRLARSAYVGGDSFTISDISAGVAFDRWSTLPLERPHLNACERWFSEVSARPAFPGRTGQSLT